MCLDSIVRSLKVQRGQLMQRHQLKMARAKTGLGDRDAFNLISKNKEKLKGSLFEEV